MAKVEIPRYERGNPTPPKEAFKGTREAYWPELGGYQPTPIYEQQLLRCGNLVEGPAIVEAQDTTIVLPPGRRYTVNEYLAGEIDRG